MTITEFINTGCGVDAVSVIYKLTNLQKGTRKANCIWMLYECYKQIKSK